MTPKLGCKHAQGFCNDARPTVDGGSMGEELLLMDMCSWTPCQAVCQTEFLRHPFVCLFDEHPHPNGRIPVLEEPECDIKLILNTITILTGFGLHIALQYATIQIYN